MSFDYVINDSGVAFYEEIVTICLVNNKQGERIKIIASNELPHTKNDVFFLL